MVSQAQGPRRAEARLAVSLLLIEQLVPVLNEKVLEERVVPLCIP